jgi:hypothetical protein
MHCRREGTFPIRRCAGRQGCKAVLLWGSAAMDCSQGRDEIQPGLKTRWLGRRLHRALSMVLFVTMLVPASPGLAQPAPRAVSGSPPVALGAAGPLSILADLKHTAATLLADLAVPFTSINRLVGPSEGNQPGTAGAPLGRVAMQAGACELYSLALHTQSLAGVAAGTLLTDILNGSGHRGPGQTQRSVNCASRRHRAAMPSDGGRASSSTRGESGGG